MIVFESAKIKSRNELFVVLNQGQYPDTVVISVLSGQTSLENSRSKLEQLSNLVVHFRTWWVTFGVSTSNSKEAFCMVYHTFLGKFQRHFLYRVRGMVLKNATRF